MFYLHTLFFKFILLLQILDDDAEVFVVKMWRFLIYESEAKKGGLPSQSSSKSAK